MSAIRAVGFSYGRIASISSNGAGSHSAPPTRSERAGTLSRMMRSIGRELDDAVRHPDSNFVPRVRNYPY